MDCNIWSTVKNGSFVSTHQVDVVVKKTRNLWTKEDKEDVKWNLKVKTIITTVLGIDEILFILFHTVTL